MKRRIEKKKWRNAVKVGLSITQCDRCKSDSIAHKIKSYFDSDTITNHMLFKWDKERNKLLVSKHQLIYLLSLCNDIENLRDYEMEIVDKIDIFK